MPAFAAPDAYEIDAAPALDRAHELRLPEYRSIRSRHGALFEIAKRETGMTVPAAVAAKSEKENSTLLQQSRRIVENLRVGFEAIDDELAEAIERRDQARDASTDFERRIHRDAMRRAARRWRMLAGPAAAQWRNGRPSGEYNRSNDYEVVTYFLHSEHRIIEPQFRRSLIIPHVAKSCRVPVVTALEAFLERTPYARFWTFTNGRRVRLCELRDAIGRFHRRINRLAKWLRSEYGIEMAFRSTELGTPEFQAVTDPATGRQKADDDGNPWTSAQAGGLVEFDTDGQPLFHVHAHCVVVPSTYRKPEAWQRVIRSVWKRWGWHWDAGATIGNPRECCKYMTKPGEMLRLQPKHLAGLALQLRRMKIVQPMGRLAAEMARRREEELRLDRAPTPEGRVYREVKDWNKHAKRTEAETELKDALAMGNRGDGGECRIMSIGAPRFAPGSRIKEPCVTVLVSGKWDAAAVRRHPLVARLIVATRDHWNAGNALAAVCAESSGAPGAIRVHTCTPTGHGDPSPDVARTRDPAGWMPATP